MQNVELMLGKTYHNRDHWYYNYYLVAGTPLWNCRYLVWWSVFSIGPKVILCIRLPATLRYERITDLIKFHCSHFGVSELEHLSVTDLMELEKLVHSALSRIRSAKVLHSVQWTNFNLLSVNYTSLSFGNENEKKKLLF